MIFSSKEIFVLRKILNLANKLQILREQDVVAKEKGNYFLEMKDIKDNFSLEKIRKKAKSFAQDDKKAFLRGVFLGCGIISTPPSYHLEMRFESERGLDFVSRVLHAFKIKHSANSLKIYIKGRENIKKFLFGIKAQESYLLLEEDAVIKEVANETNRKANFEYANLERQTKSSSKTLSLLERLKSNGKLEKLREDLKEVAMYKLTYPFLPLSELAGKTQGKYTKQSIYYRLKKIEKAYGE